MQKSNQCWHENNTGIELALHKCTKQEYTNDATITQDEYNNATTMTRQLIRKSQKCTKHIKRMTHKYNKMVGFLKSVGKSPMEFLSYLCFSAVCDRWLSKHQRVILSRSWGCKHRDGTSCIAPVRATFNSKPPSVSPLYWDIYIYIYIYKCHNK